MNFVNAEGIKPFPMNDPECLAAKARGDVEFVEGYCEGDGTTGNERLLRGGVCFRCS